MLREKDTKLNNKDDYVVKTRGLWRMRWERDYQTNQTQGYRSTYGIT